MIARREKGSGKFTNSEKTDKKYFLVDRTAIIESYKMTELFFNPTLCGI